MTLKINRKGRFRKALFLSTTIARGRLLKDENGHGNNGDDGIDVGAGFAEAADKMTGDDNREPEQKGGGAVQEIPEAADDENSDPNPEQDEATKQPPKKRDTAAYIRDLKRENRELKRTTQTFEQRLAAIENSPSTNKTGGDTDKATSEAPDADDATKYPLGVLDDGFIRDSIKWEAGQQVRELLESERRAQTAKAETVNAEKHVAALREKMDTLTEKGAEQFDDFEELVIEGGMRGDFNLTETTFTAAAEAANGPAILHALANDTTEAARVASLSPFQQMKYVLDQDAAIEAKKPKPRTKPAAGAPPSNVPAGRNSSAPIRADTDNLDDFRKLFYNKK